MTSANEIAAVSDRAYLLSGGDRVVLITRMSPEAAAYVGEHHALVYDPLSKVGRIGDMPEPDAVGRFFSSPKRQTRKRWGSSTASSIQSSQNLRILSISPLWPQ